MSLPALLLSARLIALLRTLVCGVAMAACTAHACMPWNEGAIEKVYEAKKWEEVVNLTASDLENLSAAYFEGMRPAAPP